MSELSSTTPSTARQLDPASVHTWLRRLSRADAAPWLHAEVARRMAERLQVIRSKPEELVDWWSFGGASAELLHTAYPGARIVTVEPIEALRARSREALAAPWWSVRRWLGHSSQVSLPDDVQPGKAQLVWANMMLHAVVDPTQTIARWHRALAVDGFVMFSCLGPGSLMALRDLYAQLGWPPPLADFVDMHDLGDMLVHAGFAYPVMDQEVLTLSWDSPEALLSELRTMGANASPQRAAGLRTPRWRARLHEALRGLARPDARLYLQFEVAYGHAFKAPPRVPLSSETTVSLDDMRAMVRNKTPRG